MKSFKSEQGFSHIVLLVILAVVVAGVGFFAYQRVHNANTAKSTVDLPSAAKSAKSPRVIQTEKFSTSVGANGAVINSTSTFAPTDKKIYTVLSLKNAKVGQRLEYVRYLNNKFVDNGSVAVSKDGAQYAGFGFTLKPGKAHPKGIYRVKVYTDGSYETAANYTVK
jgi:flagellar basal body-associated protein FliL